MPCARAGSGCRKTEPDHDRRPTRHRRTMTDAARPRHHAADPAGPVRADGRRARAPRHRARRGRPAHRPGEDRGRATRDAARRCVREARDGDRGGGLCGPTLDPTAAADLNAQLVLVTQRAALMESQVDVLEGKRRALGRYRDALADLQRDPRAPTATCPRHRPMPSKAVAAAGRPIRPGSHPRCRACCSARRRTSGARSPGRCTTARPRA